MLGELTEEFLPQLPPPQRNALEVSLLLREKRAARALEVFEICNDRHRHFAPDIAEELAALADTALAAGYDECFAQLLADLHARAPGDPAITRLLYEQARDRCERRHDDAGALAILRPLLAQADHPLHPRIAALARTLERG